MHPKCSRNQRTLATAVLAVAGSLLAPSFAAAQAIPAFPGAEGPGATASGGRIGDIYHVTSLEDDHDGTIPGTLRYGLNTATGARTIVFDVSGTIHCVPDVHQSTHTWMRTDKSNITIAGQTAPGDGITIIGQGSKFSGSNVILRHVKFRPGQDQTRPGILTNDGISNYLQNSIIDHVSVSWADDEALSSTDFVNNTTVQYSIVGEGLNYQLDDGSRHAFGALISSQNNDAPESYHHNLFAHLTTRDPRLGSEAGTGAVLNFANNVVYNWKGRAGYSIAGKPSRTNYLDNYYIAGPNTASTDPVFYSPDTNTRIYHDNTNLVDMTTDGTLNGVTFGFSGPQFQGTISNEATPFSVTTPYLQTATAAVPTVLDYAGAMWWSRDPIDARLVSDVQNGTGGIIDYINQVPQDPNYTYDATGFPIYPEIHRPADFDTDQDGMSGAWEIAHGLNPTKKSDAYGDFDADGYTNLEEYLIELGEWPAPIALIFTGATNSRYEQTTNWSLQWEPSKYDEAQINAGAVTVNSVGQHARILKVASTAGSSATLTVNSGWLEVAEQLQVANDGQVIINGGALLTPQVHLSNAAQLKLSPGANKTLKTGMITISNTAKLDVSDNQLLITGMSVGDWNGSSYTGVTKLVADGRNGGAWNGAGIITSQTSAQSPEILTTLAVATAEQAGFVGGLFGGYTVAPTDVLVMYTFAGDANLSGDIDADDYFQIDSHYGKTAAASLGYFNGDFNYDGTVDGGDYFLIDSNYSGLHGANSLSMQAVPEPAIGFVAAMAALVLSQRRRLAGRPCQTAVPRPSEGGQCAHS
jgi:hypothetical protein